MMIVIVLTGLSSTKAQTEDEKRWPTLLWEISGNGMQKPSYLYGTMHVSSKLAFHLGDPFFKALGSADVVALELHHENWLDAELSEKNLLQSYGIADSQGFGDYYSEESYGSSNLFKYDQNRRDLILGTLHFYPRVAGEIVSRNSEWVDYEEDSWLDYFIYQCGRKLKKEIFGLETFDESMHAYNLAMKWEYDHRKDEDNEDEVGWEERQEMYDMLETAYRTGDLDMLDSISAKTSGKGWRKYILEYRNEIFVGRIDSILSSGKNMFIGMGAAHLPGEAGVIEMLRRLGYTLKPIKPGKRNPKAMEALEEKEYPSTFNRYESPTGLFSLDVPAKVYYLPIDHQMIVEACMDLPNASTLYIIRSRHFGGAVNLKPSDLVASIDSMLYENIPGDIQSQKNITFAGYPAIEVTSKSKQGQYIRFRIITLEDELFVIRLDAPGTMAISRYGDRIFNSFKLNINRPANWETFKSPNGAIEVKVPGTALHHDLKYFTHRDETIGLTASDPVTGSYYVVLQTEISSPWHMEPDQFEIEEIEFELRTSRETRVKSKKWLTWQGHNALEVSYENKTGEKLLVRYILVNTSVYALVVHHPLEEDASRFFNSFTISNPEFDGYRMQTDSSIMASFEIPYELPEDNDRWGWGGYGDDNDFEGTTNYGNYAPLNGGDGVSVRHSVLGKYEYYPDSTKVEKILEEEISADGKWIVIDRKHWKDGLNEYYEFVAGDTACTRQSWVRHILRPNSSYRLTCRYDTVLGRPEFATRFYNSFTPIDSVLRDHAYENRSLLFLQDITSEDSTTYANAYDLISSVELRPDSAKILHQYLNKVSKWAKPEEVRSIKYKIIRSLGEYEDKNNVDFLVNSFRSWADSSSIQMIAMTALAEIETKECYEELTKLLKEQAPLGVSKSDISTFFYASRDSIELSAAFFPEIMNLMDIDEYRYTALYHLSRLVDSSLVKPAQLKPYVPELVARARVEYRRLNSSKNIIGKKDNYYETSYSDISNLTSYLNILMPFRNETEVKALFNQVSSTKHNDVLRKVITEYVDNDIAVPDSIMRKVASDKKEGRYLYSYLKETEKDSLFPADLIDQKAFVEQYLHAQKKSYNENELDSVVFIKTAPLTVRNDSGEGWIYKYRRKPKDEWILCVVGIMPSDSSEIIIYPQFAYSGKEEPKLDKKSDEELEEMYEMLIRKAIRSHVSDLQEDEFNFADLTDTYD